MKILHVSLNPNGQKPVGMIRALKKLGSYHHVDWKRQIRQMGLWQFRQRLVMLSKVYNPDIIFMQLQTPGIIDAKTARKLQGFVVNWTGDVRSDIEWYKELGKHINLTCFTNETDVEKCEKEGVKAAYLQTGFNPEIFKPEGERQEIGEIVFLGNNYGNRFPAGRERRDMVNMLKQKYPDFKVYGNWKGARSLNQHQEAACYRGCKIAIGISHYDHERYTSDRLLRALGSGAFYLTKWYSGIEQDFEPGKHLQVWRNKEELCILIDYYLQQSAERQKIAELGCAHVHEHYNWDNFGQHLVELYQKHSKK